MQAVVMCILAAVLTFGPHTTLWDAICTGLAIVVLLLAISYAHSFDEVVLRLFKLYLQNKK